MAADDLHFTFTRTLSTVLATSFFFVLLCSSLQVRGVNYTFMKDAALAPSVSYYDYIIVGGGTAGCPLVATLSEHFRVLLLERGGSPYDDERIGDMARFADTMSDTSPGSPAQRFVSEDGVINSRPRVLGGGSCINAGFYTRASDDYVRDAGWDLGATGAAYRWVEDVVAFQPELGPWQAALQSGLLEAGRSERSSSKMLRLRGMLAGTAKPAGTEFTWPGHSSVPGELTGGYFGARETAGGTRRGVPRLRGADAQGVPQRRPPERDRPLGGRHGQPPATDAQRRRPSRPARSASASCGVGQGMSDNPMNAIYVPSPSPVEISLIQVVGITQVGSYIEGASGSNWGVRPSASGGVHRPRNFGMFSPQTGQLATVPPKQRTPEAIASAAEAMRQLDDSAFRGGFILEKVLGPLSTGHLELRNRDPDDNPSVTFNYFSHPEDLRRCVAGLSVIERVIHSKAFENFTYSDFSMETLLNMSTGFPVNLLPRHDSDSTSLEMFCKDTVMTIWHYHGGCQVARVVDAEYRVLGVDALRVIDGSTFNASPGTNTQATVMMLGRYMGVRIQNERLKAEGVEGTLWALWIL
ncbi:unnamed protein product [Miscanthus lutarioriparius]|uniref:Glucose-methanol-choline oxidoreductase C-terminal domain-containing protein n=1 Tax=Miscanthus lutarioriparius TaxID=422564 RepID=A0A811QLA0_9POAL|nr:unnamed protein product [Miscanthus lutarioriparius]